MSRLRQGLQSWFVAQKISLEQESHITVLILVINHLRADPLC